MRKGIPRLLPALSRLSTTFGESRTTVTQLGLSSPGRLRPTRSAGLEYPKIERIGSVKPLLLSGIAGAPCSLRLPRLSGTGGQGLGLAFG
jgi:hypothetical protein